MGLACGATNAGGSPVSVAMVRLWPDGSLTVFAGSTEMSQGVRTVLSQIVADELSLPLGRSAKDTAARIWSDTRK